MRLVLAGGGADGDEIRRRLGRRLRLAVGRFATRIDRVRLRLVAAPGAEAGRAGGGCRLEIRLRSGDPLVFEERGVDPEAAAARAADRAARTLDRLLGGEPADMARARL